MSDSAFLSSPGFFPFTGECACSPLCLPTYPRSYLQKGAPFLVSVPCKNFYKKLKNPNFKFKVSSTFSGAIFEKFNGKNDTDYEGHNYTNSGKISNYGYNLISGEVNETLCSCERVWTYPAFNVVIELYARTIGQYTIKIPSLDDPYIGSYDRADPISLYIVFVRPNNPKSDNIEIWSGTDCIAGLNATTCKRQEYKVKGLSSTGFLKGTIFEKSFTLAFPYNYWAPEWAKLPGSYQGYSSFKGTFDFSIEGC